MEINSSASTICFRDIHLHFQALPQLEVILLSEVAKLIKFVLLLMPATNAVSERSASAMRRIKTYLHSIKAKQCDASTHSQALN